MAEDYYKTLGIERGASDTDIRKAFHRMAKKYHPDANPDNPAAEARFKEVNEAYEVLRDPEKRAQYDQFGANYNPFQGFQQSPGGGGFHQYTRVDMEDSPFADVLDSLFGTMGKRGRGRTRAQAHPMPGQNIEHTVTITLEEAYTGTVRHVTKGARRIKVNIPAGAATGTKVRLTGEGESGTMGAVSGDLYLVVEVQPNPRFERDGDNLNVEVKVDMFTAILGGDIEVPTLSRPVKIRVPAGTQSGQKLRVTGKGMPNLREKDKYGDLYAYVRITVPRKLTPHQRALVEELKASFEASDESS